MVESALRTVRRVFSRAQRGVTFGTDVYGAVSLVRHQPGVTAAEVYDGLGIHPIWLDDTGL